MQKNIVYLFFWNRKISFGGKCIFWYCTLRKYSK